MDEKSPDPPETNGHIRGRKALELMRQATANMPRPGEHVPQRDFADYVPPQVRRDELKAITSHFENREQKATETTISPPHGGVVVIRGIVTRVVTMWKQITTRTIVRENEEKEEDMKPKKFPNPTTVATPAKPVVPTTPTAAPAKVPAAPATSAVPKPAPAASAVPKPAAAAPAAAAKPATAPAATAPGPKPAVAPAASAKPATAPAATAPAKPTTAPAAAKSGTKRATAPKPILPPPPLPPAKPAPAPAAPAGPAPVAQTATAAPCSKTAMVSVTLGTLGLAWFIALVCGVGLVIFGLAGLYFYVYRDQNVVHETRRAFEAQVAAEKALDSAHSKEAEAMIKVIEANTEVEKLKRERIIPQPFGVLVGRQMVDSSTNVTPSTVPTAPTTPTPFVTPSAPPPAGAPRSSDESMDNRPSSCTHINQQFCICYQLRSQHVPPRITVFPGNIYWNAGPLVGESCFKIEGYEGWWYYRK